jgi:hypothetical protein
MARCSLRDVRPTPVALAGVAAILALAWVAARAQPAPPGTAEPLSATVPPVDIVAPSPLPGSGVDRDTVPAETNVLRGDDLTRGGHFDYARRNAGPERAGQRRQPRFSFGQPLSADHVLPRVRGVGAGSNATRARPLCQRRPLQFGFRRHAAS